MKLIPALHGHFANGISHLSATGFFLLAAVPAFCDTTYVPGDTQYIAALGNSAATSGDDAQTFACSGREQIQTE